MRDLHVFPCAPDSKKPLERDWQFNTALWSEAAARWPKAERWGAPAGPVNGHWVLDIDVKTGGPVTLAALEREHGPLPRTLMVRTPSGGVHYWFRWRDDRPVRTWVARRGGIDTRGPGGYTLIPPSDGYVWQEAEIAEAPEWLYQELRVGAPVTEPGVATERPPGLLTDLDGAQHDCRTWPPAIQGSNGSGTLFRLALRLVRGRGVQPAAAARLIEEEYNARCIPPWSREEIKHKVEDAAENGEAPWGYTFYHGSLPTVLRRALRAYGPPGALGACVPYLVAPDGSMQQRDRHEGLCNAVIKICAAMDQHVTTDEAWRIVSWWKTHVEPVDYTPPPVVVGDAPGPALARLVVRAGPTPAWDEFLSRLSDPDTFLAWVWMLTLPKVTRQVLWISGAGKDGKTVVTAVLLAMLGQAGTTCTDDYVENASRWVGGQLYGKRLVVVDDTKMRQVLRRGIVHRATGGSPMKMEMKGVDGFDYTPNAAFICTSNFTPQIGRGRADRTRLLPLTIEGGDRVADGQWSERLRDEIPGLLARAQDAYKRLAAAPGQPELRLTETVQCALNEAAGHDGRGYRTRLETAGLALGEGQIAGNELFNRLRIANTNGDWPDFRDWLLEQGVRYDHTDKGTIWRGIRSIA